MDATLLEHRHLDLLRAVKRTLILRDQPDAWSCEETEQWLQKKMGGRTND